MGENS
jgi:hypothetical protein